MSNLTTLPPTPAADAPRSSGMGLEVLVTLVNRAYDRAKLWAGAGLILQGTLFIAGIVAIFWPSATLSYPWVAVPMALVGAEIARRASHYKSLAETAKRQHEQFCGFGTKPSGTQLADLRQSLRKQLSDEDDRLLKLGITYSSEQPTGPRRALENLCESAWYTRHLAGKCVVWVATTVLLSLSVAIVLLLWTASNWSGSSTGLAAAKSIAASFTFLISVGSIRNWVAYAKLSHKAKDIDSEAARLLAKKELEHVEAQRLLTEYQVSRAGAPLVPTWIWKLYRDSLNEDWNLRNEKHEH